MSNSPNNPFINSNNNNNNMSLVVHTQLVFTHF